MDNHTINANLGILAVTETKSLGSVHLPQARDGRHHRGGKQSAVRQLVAKERGQLVHNLSFTSARDVRAHVFAAHVFAAHVKDFDLDLIDQITQVRNTALLAVGSQHRAHVGGHAVQDQTVVGVLCETVSAC